MQKTHVNLPFPIHVWGVGERSEVFTIRKGMK